MGTIIILRARSRDCLIDLGSQVGDRKSAKVWFIQVGPRLYSLFSAALAIYDRLRKHLNAQDAEDANARFRESVRFRVIGLKQNLKPNKSMTAESLHL